MRNFKVLLAGLLLVTGCQKPVRTMNYSALDCLPPASERRAKEGSLAIWALAGQGGKVSFYLLAPANSFPEALVVRMGRSSFPVEAKVEQGRTFFTWEVKLGDEGVFREKFDQPMVLEARFRGGARHCMTISGLGTESYPVLNMCYFDLSWEARPCP